MYIFLCSFCIRILPPISASLQIHWLQFSGHSRRSKNETVSQLLLWEPKHGRHSKGAPSNNPQHLLTNLESDTVQSCEAGSRICHGQQMGVGQIYKISADAPEIDR